MRFPESSGFPICPSDLMGFCEYFSLSRFLLHPKFRESVFSLGK